MAKDTQKSLRNQVMYSVYVRNHSEEGTFKAVENDLDRIKELGVDIVWLLPVHPTGEKARKGELGSPYANRDYRKINPEFGTLEDFKGLVEAIHDKGMKCIIDVVYNHTSPDSWLAVNHPEYFFKKPDGTMGNRVGEWDDIVDLDYNQAGLWEYQIETLKMWAGIVDGFRCDVAPLLPLDFWLRAREEVGKVRADCLWLSESVEPEFIIDLRAKGMINLSDSEIFQAFDICYDYDIHKYFRGYLTGDYKLSYYAEKINMQEYIYPDNYVKLRYLENHDQARAKEIIQDDNDLINWTAFIYFQKGMTLIYAGQETENDFRPDLFNKDTVNWNTGKDISALLKSLYPIKKKEIVAKGSYHVTALDEEDILVGTYTLNEHKMMGVFSVKSKTAEVETGLPDGSYQNLVDGSNVFVKEGKLLSEGKPIIIEL
ncbi:alpha-amylase family glycosyl hydrolase [Paenibacillus sabinae]|uniref:Alpha amylase n=1 Tax=Paenibacillus sabinae T27 TaxID=1268072 RepID=X5A3E8_9BACL|nr:alpha-amylase family glycosyl hydrolase [Paenibacillus sabinae]AHV98329.1 alpha amylase [Paenibacillus sabinae T27]